MENDSPETIEVLGVRVHNVTMDAALRRLEGFLGGGGPQQVVTVNPEFVVAAQRQPRFRDVLNHADLAIPDGIGLVAMSRLLGAPLAARVAGADLVVELLRLGVRRGARVFFFGAADGVAAQAARELTHQIPNLQIVGAENEHDVRGGVRSDAEIVQRITAAEPDILLVALGAPEQDLWIANHLARLPSVKIGIGVGGTFDYLAGRLPRAPRAVRSVGLEWLWRLVLQPSRWRRIVTATIRFPWLVLTTPNAIVKQRPS